MHSMAVGLFPHGEWDQVHFVTLLVPPVTPLGSLKLRGESGCFKNAAASEVIRTAKKEARRFSLC